MVELYDYQKDIFLAWAKNNYWGIVKAPTASGKTKGAVYTLKQYIANFPEKKCVIITPSSKVCGQWEKECKLQSINVPITTYMKAINEMYRGNLKADCLVLDECHRASPEKQSSAVMKLHPTAVLGLSATPGNSVQLFGQPFYEVGWDKANICDFMVHYAKYTPSKNEIDEYDKWTKLMKNVAQEVAGTPSLRPGISQKYDFFAMKRRDICYTFKSRLHHTFNLIKTYQSKRMLVFFERNEQIKEMSFLLDKNGIRHSICSQLQDTLSDFEEHKTNILLLAKKLREGFNDNEIEIVILASPTTRSLSHTQVVGRALRLDRNNPNKKANIFALIAKDTSDESLIYNNDFPKTNVDITTIDSIINLAPGISSIKTTSHSLDDYLRIY